MKIKQKKVVIVFCEGEAEINLFGFLKAQFSNKKIEFRKTVDLCGFSDFKSFKRKYDKKVKAQNFKPKKDYVGIKFLFLIDNDLADSERIKSFVEANDHFVQLCDPNTEGMILALIGKPQIRDVDDKEFRKKCKNKFKSCFECEAHQLKEGKLKEVFNNEEIFKNTLNILHSLFKS